MNDARAENIRGSMEVSDAHRPAVEFIQALRGIAALCVVVLHAGWSHAGYVGNNAYRHALSSGIVGVDLFFIISGFIMYYTIPANSGGWRDAWRFGIKRLTRIWPPYAVWTMVITAIALGLPGSKALLDPFTWPDFFRSLSFLPTTVRFFPPAYTLPILNVGWTLNYEMYFYLVLFACLFTARWKWLVFTLWLAAAMLVAPALASMGVNGTPSASAMSSALAMTLRSPIMWEFVVGMLIAHGYKRGCQFTRLRSSLLMAAAACIFLIVQCIVVKQIDHGLAHCGLPAACIVLALALAPRSRLRVWYPLTWLGKISYSLYLVHLPVLVVVETMLAIRMQPLDPLLLACWIVCACALSVVVAALSQRWLEVGLSNALRKLLLWPSGKTRARMES
jgi:peptidoglycan/LPS O-acetylase OafA/YrhL